MRGCVTFQCQWKITLTIHWYWYRCVDQLWVSVGLVVSSGVRAIQSGSQCANQFDWFVVCRVTASWSNKQHFLLLWGSSGGACVRVWIHTCIHVFFTQCDPWIREAENGQMWVPAPTHQQVLFFYYFNVFLGKFLHLIEKYIERWWL